MNMYVERQKNVQISIVINNFFQTLVKVNVQKSILFHYTINKQF